jgi:hypothetical protein
MDNKMERKTFSGFSWWQPPPDKLKGHAPRSRVFYDEVISQPAFVISIKAISDGGSQGLFPNKKPHWRGSGSAFPMTRLRASFKILKKVRLNSLVFLFRLRIIIHI